MDMYVLAVMLLLINLSETLLQQPWLVDIKSNPENVKMTLDAFHDQLVVCQKKAEEYRNYQKLFKVRIYSLTASLIILRYLN
jgi:hypothetical protein